MPFVILQSSDYKKFYIDTEVAKYFGTIKNLLSYCGVDAEMQGIIPLPNVDEDTLNKVLEWINKDARCRTLANLGKETLFKLLIAANYLDIPDLVSATSKEIARVMEDEENTWLQSDWLKQKPKK